MDCFCDFSGDLEKVEEMRRNNGNIWPAVAKLSEVESLEAAMEGCRGVFHTTGFIDPAGLSGYSVSLFQCFQSNFILFTTVFFSLIFFKNLKIIIKLI